MGLKVSAPAEIFDHEVNGGRAHQDGQDGSGPKDQSPLLLVPIQPGKEGFAQKARQEKLISFHGRHDQIIRTRNADQGGSSKNGAKHRGILPSEG